MAVQRAILVIAGVLLMGCAGFREQVCSAEADIASALEESGSFLGPLGGVVSGAGKLALGAMCGAIETSAAVVEAGPRALGMLPAEEQADPIGDMLRAAAAQRESEQPQPQAQSSFMEQIRRAAEQGR